jgi:hypothetical protein
MRVCVTAASGPALYSCSCCAAALLATVPKCGSEHPPSTSSSRMQGAVSYHAMACCCTISILWTHAPACAWAWRPELPAARTDDAAHRVTSVDASLRAAVRPAPQRRAVRVRQKWRCVRRHHRGADGRFRPASCSGCATGRYKAPSNNECQGVCGSALVGPGRSAACRHARDGDAGGAAKSAIYCP